MDNLKLRFENFDPQIKIASPGRINLIGEHTDYNQGFVFPAAIDKRIIYSIRENGSANECVIYSSDFDKILKVDLDNVKPSEEEWENYILGVIYEIQKKNISLRGFDCIIESDLPIGAGVSSSAAMECGLAFSLNRLFDLGLSKLDIVLIGQMAEHNFVGTKCGIMDQYASVMSMEGHAILLDCKDISHEYIPIELEPYTLLLLNTNVSHNLATGEYNTRRAECFEGVDILKKAGLEIESLRDLNEETLNEHKALLSEQVYRRCHYVVKENERVLKASHALRNNNLQEFGALLYQSHEGLQLEYEVSCEELDFLVDFSRNKPYVLGSRMMGGGFGGCTLNLIHKDHLDAYIKEVKVAYKEKFGIEADPIPVSPTRGTHLIQYKKMVK